jgi:hypothetical protein
MASSPPDADLDRGQAMRMRTDAGGFRQLYRGSGSASGTGAGAAQATR